MPNQNKEYMNIHKHKQTMNYADVQYQSHSTLTAASFCE